MVHQILLLRYQKEYNWNQQTVHIYLSHLVDDYDYQDELQCIRYHVSSTPVHWVDHPEYLGTLSFLPQLLPIVFPSPLTGQLVRV